MKTNHTKIATFARTAAITLVHACVGFLLFYYALIACSTIENNIFHIGYEPSGFQLVLYFFSFPVFFFLTIVMSIAQRSIYKKPLITWFPLIVWTLFFALLEFANDVITFPSGKHFFYYGALSLTFLLSVMNVLMWLWQVTQPALKNKYSSRLFF